MEWAARGTSSMRAVPAGESSNRMALAAPAPAAPPFDAPGGCRNSGSGSGGTSRGRRLRPLCSQAETAIARQWSSLRAACGALKRTTLRSVRSGTMLDAPSSVAFCTTRSMRSPRETPWARVSDSGDSRSIACASPTATSTFSPCTASMVAAYCPPPPLNRVSACPGRSRSTRVRWRAALPVSATRPPASSGASRYTRVSRMSRIRCPRAPPRPSDRSRRA